MAIINVSAPKEHPVEIKLPAMTEEVKEACEDYMHYIKFILEPAKLEIATTVRKNRVSLHQAFGANLILAHSVDYLKAIRSAAGIKESRANLIKSFDGSMPFCVELDSINDTGVPSHQPAVSPVAAGWPVNA